ncbi:MAG: hypothetical protein KJ046_15025 [Anaerolineae bacterium]|nr:hypothetical protein [Anaerolineae bacterium]
MTTRKILHWAPRVTGVLYAVFISLFALDVWGTGASFWEELAAFLIHLLPVYLILIALFVAWWNSWLGGILFIFLATLFSLLFGWRDPVTLLLLALPPTVTGLLFMADGCISKAELRPRM